MFRRHLTATLTVCLLASAPAFFEEGNEAGAQEAAPAPSLNELKAVVQPLLEGLGLTAEQQNKANGVMSEEAWKTIVEGFEVKRGGEIFTAAHEKMNALVPTIVMPRMMAHSMKKAMGDRMAKKTGPPTAKELEAVRKDTKKLMRGKLAPQLMGNLEELSEQRMQEVLADKKALVRVLGEKLSEVVLTEGQKPKLEKALTDAGYPKDLIHGPDDILEGRMKKMVPEVTEKELASLEAGE